MHVLAMAVELHLPASRSLKEKRSVLRPVVEGIRSRFAVAVAETGHQDLLQRAQVGVAAVSSSPKIAIEVMDEVERFVWSFPELEVLSANRYWAEEDGVYRPDEDERDGI